ncbi:bifunctional GNAT family N-acetyltransferase/(deoxy)nucleoside triphosphate pyrophosphohydrolase [Paramagnetospirillum magneticum]|uniref:8-oxo-dGTP diphosphatase n=1 Tax=Paramagnetospirillum magneticum (strain ATCC 700264 / AMB-1) TaxID=342108 RepID=Q2WA12_PARM1|nr:bifunctional GNAT family N-acetyltransferase/(deoxy)nucleoside triphosphate pyrophosphohydrolase [Paramagnetospirillum magneticum]BAE49313.1 NTP pyrophosphohydrolase [Paramagnetospirillum magneticum AMB-1]
MAERGCREPGTVWAGHPLLTARLRLRPVSDKDLDALVALLGDWDVVRLTAAIPHPYAVDDAKAFVAAQEVRRIEHKGVALALERTTDGVLVGVMGFGLERDGTPELGYWIGKDFWGQGYATEAANRLIRHLFDTLGFERVWAQFHPDNTGSKRVLEKVGLTFHRVDACPMPARGESVISPVFQLRRAEWLMARSLRPTVLVVAAALVDGDGRVLMASRPTGKSMEGLWEFPGGKIHDGETPEAALVRELEEELGIDVRESCLAPVAFASHDYDTFHLLMPLYLVRVWKGNPSAREGQELRWIRVPRLGDLPMPPADIPLVAILREWV